jgi:hypothetical protein
MKTILMRDIGLCTLGVVVVIHLVRYVSPNVGVRLIGMQEKKRGFNVGQARQSKNQDWNKSNRALRENVHNEKPVRVIRGYKGDSVWSPSEGFMYAGLYEVVACWVEQGTLTPTLRWDVDGQGNRALM